MIIMPALFVVFAEHIGHVVVTSSIVDRDLIKNPGLNRSFSVTYERSFSVTCERSFGNNKSPTR